MTRTIMIERDVRVPMRDGVALATDVYRPADGGRHPVLVHRTPYGKGDAWVVGGLMLNPLDAVERGYVVVVQDCRGRFASDGTWIPFVVEGPDGYDAIEWAASQSWSTGRVGIYGSSYNGVTTLQATIAAPPHLGACVAYMTGANYHDGWVYSGGAFELGFNFWWALHQAWGEVARLGLDEAGIAEAMARLGRGVTDPWPALRHLPLCDQPLLGGGLAPYYYDWLAHPTYDEYWRPLDAVARAAEITVPVLHISGWYDGFLRGHLDLNERLAAHSDPRVRDRHRFVVGPWDHMAYLGVRKSAAGRREFGPTAFGGPSFATEMTLEWFDRWLADWEPTAAQQARVRYFMMGENRWRDADAWPPPHVARRYYLQSGGRAATRFGDGTLTTDAPAAAGTDSYVYDPADPVPTFGGRSMAPAYCEAGVQDQSGIEERPDVLVYSSAHLLAPLAIAGPVSVTLFVTSSAVDTDFTAKLVDVEPDGYCAPIAEGILRARYRRGPDREVLLVPGEVTEIAVDLLAVAHVFREGHRLRLEVSSSNFPKYDRNLNCAVSPGRATAADMRCAVQHVLHGGAHASHVTLPVVP
ncbi:MAG: CocE/NonD family hydrolase [Candidatus Binatia bacterium]